MGRKSRFKPTGLIMKIRTALVSVSDKTGLVDFVKELEKMGVWVISTGGTKKVLRDAGLVATDIAVFTGSPEILDGRVKTLHLKVHGGLLFRRGNAEHEQEAAENGIKPIDLVVVNLYPFEQTVSKPDCTEEDAIENIDIGGPSMLRSAAKNFESVTVVSDPKDYGRVLAEMKANDGDTTPQFRWYLAKKVFMTTALYDLSIFCYFAWGRILTSIQEIKIKMDNWLEHAVGPHDHV